jgi:hypothetical protein
VLPIPATDQQIQWGGTLQQLGRGASKITLDGGTGNVSVPGVLSVTSSSPAALVVTCPSSNGNIRVAPHTSGQETTISFARNTNQAVDVRGDMWILGRAVFSVGDRNFGIGRFGPDGGNALTITEAGVVNIPDSLTVGSVAVERYPWISAFVQANGVVCNNRGQRVATCSKGIPSPITGEYNIFWQAFNHPDGMNYIVHATPAIW